MTDGERETTSQLYQELEYHVEEWNEKVDTHSSWQKAIRDGHHLSISDPNVGYLNEFKRSAETAIGLINSVRDTVQRIFDLRFRHATYDSLAWTRGLKEYTNSARREYNVDIEAVQKAVEDLRKPGGKKILPAYDARQRRSEALRERFLDEPLDPDFFVGSWRGAVDLGGGISKAGLWVCLSQHGNIIDVSSP